MFMVHDPELVLCFRKRKKKGVQKTRICFLNVLLNTRKAGLRQAQPPKAIIFKYERFGRGVLYSKRPARNTCISFVVKFCTQNAPTNVYL